ncbi:MAG: hypothetical protein JWN60_2555 [Acidobacteria bacterium]|nr:hypothetical protein [Acidobacteriota bacterium]
MSKRFFVDDVVTGDGRYRVLQEDSETKERFGVKDFDTKEEARRTAEDMQRAVDNALSEITARELPDQISLEDNSEIHGNKFKDTLQDLKNGNSQE